MSKELMKKAVELLLNGATLVSDPCPYCKGVRIIKNGNALCVSCGKDAVVQKSENELKTEEDTGSPVDRLDEKLKNLTNELYLEKNHERQQQILRSINEIISIKERLKNL